MDTPAAPSLLETVIESGKVAGWIPSDFAGIAPPPTPRYCLSSCSSWVLVVVLLLLSLSLLVVVCQAVAALHQPNQAKPSQAKPSQAKPNPNPNRTPPLATNNLQERVGNHVGAGAADAGTADGRVCLVPQGVPAGHSRPPQAHQPVHRQLLRRERRGGRVRRSSAIKKIKFVAGEAQTSRVWKEKGVGGGGASIINQWTCRIGKRRD